MLRRERPKPLAFALVSIVDFGRVADDQIASGRQSSRVLMMGGSDGANVTSGRSNSRYTALQTAQPSV